MRRADLDRVVEIERESFSIPWSRGAFQYEIEQNRVARCWTGRVDGEVIGYLCLWEIGEEIHITNVAVARAWRRQGIARSMLTEILDDARRRGLRMAFLEVRPTNVEALGLYEALGFHVIGRRKGYYYDTGEDALVMEAELGAARPGKLR
ncbi:MAG: ribosomal protein S18-alanine N-acetyltransferase [Candidatus Rokubacteria bacterium]|nr:ribosomal protein S18-alanine N-acetyltransferase [Candidatus Rokubacteria bacterium]